MFTSVWELEGTSVYVTYRIKPGLEVTCPKVGHDLSPVALEIDCFDLRDADGEQRVDR